MDAFIHLAARPAQPREAEHGGVGPIAFRRLLDHTHLASGLDFVDFTIIPPGSTIGKHFHHASEEIYFVVSGEPLISIDGEENRAYPGTLSVVRAGQWHSLTNDGSADVTILVVQAGVTDPVSAENGRVVGVSDDDSRVEPIHLEMQATHEVHYSVLHTERPVFDLDEVTLLEIVRDRAVLFVVDRNVDVLYGELIRAYAGRHLDAVGHVVIDGEESKKTWTQAEVICAAAMEVGLGRTGVIVGVGGGVVLDTSGFAASIYRRGIGYVRIPTTLVGQVDVSVGVKHGVNSGGLKNVLGSFHAPLASINDVSLLRSLPSVQIAAGFAEIIKIAMIADGVLFDLVERYGAALLASGFQHPAMPARAIMQRAEAAMMRELKGNLFETNLKRRVDFGHTFSVAIESDSHFQIPHGIAVGFDMLIATGLAVDRGLCEMAVLKRLVALFVTVGLPVSQRVCSAERLYLSLASVRAHRGGALNLVVPLHIGRPAFVQEVAVGELRRSLRLLDETESVDGRPCL